MVDTPPSEVSTKLPYSAALRVTYVRLGVTRFMLWFMDFPRLDGIRLFAKAILPKFW